MKRIELNKLNMAEIKKKFRELYRFGNLLYRNYSDNDTQILARSLTYFSLLALFPVIALALGITKGFGLDRVFIGKLFELVPQNEAMVRTILDIANNLLKSAQGGVLAGAGIIILLNSVIKVLMTLENSFNKIWRVNKRRSFTRRIIDCVSVVFVGPIFLIVLVGTNSFVVEKAEEIFFGGNAAAGFFAHLLGSIFYILLFTLLFYLIPNTNVKLKPAVISGIITAFLCYILKTVFVFLQASITKYNAIYGSLALIPIFLIWVQYIWVTILLGAQISFSIQSSDEFFFDEKIEIPMKYRKETGLLILYLIIERFEKNEEPYTYMELSRELKIEVSVLKEILMELEKLNFINEIIYNKNEETRYQIGINPETFSIEGYIENMEHKNTDYYDDIFDDLKDEEKKLLEIIRENITVKNEKLIKDMKKIKDTEKMK